MRTFKRRVVGGRADQEKSQKCFNEIFGRVGGNHDDPQRFVFAFPRQNLLKSKFLQELWGKEGASLMLTSR